LPLTALQLFPRVALQFFQNLLSIPEKPLLLLAHISSLGFEKSFILLRPLLLLRIRQAVVNPSIESRFHYCPCALLCFDFKLPLEWQQLHSDEIVYTLVTRKPLVNEFLPHFLGVLFRFYPFLLLVLPLQALFVTLALCTQQSLPRAASQSAEKRT